MSKKPVRADFTLQVEYRDIDSLIRATEPEFIELTFRMHPEQAEQVQRAVRAAKKEGDLEVRPGSTSDGAALARVAETWLTDHGD